MNTTVVPQSLTSADIKAQYEQAKDAAVAAHEWRLLDSARQLHRMIEEAAYARDALLEAIGEKP